MFTNRSIGKYQNYYNDLFMLNFNNIHKNNKILYSNREKKYGFVLWYLLINNKKLTSFYMRGIPLKKRNMKKNININQTVLLESLVSNQKVYFHVPIHSEWFHLS